MSRRSAGRRARVVLVAILILLSAIPRPSSASLIIILYHNQALYVAGDSDVTSLETGKRVGTTRKVYPIAENCCVTLIGSAIYDLETVSGKSLAARNFSKLLEQLSASQLASSAPLNQKMNSIAVSMNQAYTPLRTNGWAKLNVTETPQPIVLHFAGCDTAKNCFFVHGCMLSATNDVHIEPVKLYHGATDRHPFVLLGEATFLQALLPGDKPELASLVRRNPPPPPRRSGPMKAFPMPGSPVSSLSCSVSTRATRPGSAMKRDILARLIWYSKSQTIV